MKKLRFWAFTFLLVSLLCLPMGTATAQLKATLEGHTEVVWSVAFSLDGKTLASGSWDQTIRLWDVETEQLLHILTGHTSHVTSVAFSLDGQTLVSGSWDSTIRLWNPNTGEHQKTLTDHADGVGSVVFSPDGQILASGSGDQTINLWNTTTWQVDRTLTGHTSVVDSVAFSTDGTMLASGSRDKTIRLWNPNTGKLKRALEHTSEVNRLAFSPDGATLASGHWDNTVRLWNPHTGELKTALPNQGGWANAVAFSSDGGTLAIGGQGISLWDTDTEQYKVSLIEAIGSAVSVVFSPDGGTIASGSADNLVRLLESTPPEVPFTNIPFDINNIPEPVPPPPAVRDFFQLDPYYQQWINVSGFPVLASVEVSPYTLKEAAWTIGHMVGHRPDILKAMAQIKARFSIVPHNKHLHEIPEVDFGRLNWFSEVRGRGAGGLTTTSPEENIICGDSNYCYAELIHEFAHQLHGWGLNQIDSTFDSRLETMYNAAIKEGLYQERYAGTNRWEYWAEGVESWFNSLHPDNVAHTREALKKYDPRLAILLTEVFGDSSWRYTPPATRTHLPHLQGFNPQEAPIYQRPPELLELDEQLRNPNSDGDGKWVNLKLYHPSGLSHLKKQTTGGQRTDFLFANFTGTNLALYFFNADGKKILYQYFITTDFWEIYTEVGAIWLIQDHTGKDLAVFQAVEKTGRVLVTPTPFLITPGLSKVSGDNQTGVSGAVLTNPFVIEVRDQNLSVLEGIAVTFTITAGDGTLSATHATTDENGRAKSALTLGPNIGANTVQASAAGIEPTVTFNAVVEAAVNIPDTNLRAAVETALRVTPGTPIVSSEMETLTRLETQNANISDLTGLEFATNLTLLYFPESSISDISPLVGLTNLTLLWLENSSISDITPVAGLTHLTSLSLSGNNISDITPVAGLTYLTELWLGSNSISDLSPLVANTGLRNGDKVYVRGNSLSYDSIHTHIPTLQSRGVTLEFDNRPHPALLKISGDNQKGASFTPLSQPFVVEAQDANGSALAGIPVTFAITAGGGTLNTAITRTDANGRAQSTLTLGPNLGTNTVQISASGIAVPATFHAISDTEAPSITADVNSDGSVNVLDLVVIASEFGSQGQNLAADANQDGVLNVLDLILVAGLFDGAAAAPSAQPQVPETLTAVEVQGWLTDARALEIRDPIMKRGFVVLEQLLGSLTPKETKLLSNYPNPFNPETWIPYRLADDAFVTLTIYDAAGQVVRTLDVGHRIASAYENRSRAVYWDGRNDIGEGVASGVYFYTLSTEDYSATQKMVILK